MTTKSSMNIKFAKTEKQYGCANPVNIKTDFIAYVFDGVCRYEI